MSNYESVKLIEGMTDAYANQLIDVGLNTYFEIYRLKPSTLIEKLNDPSLNTDMVVSWQKDAIKLAYTRSISVTVLTKDSLTPISGATVTVGDVNGETDEQGVVVLRRVRIEDTTILVNANGYIALQAQADLRADRLHKFNFKLVVSNSGGQYITFHSEYKGQYISVRADDYQRIRTRELAELSSTYLQAVRENTDKGTVQLVSLFREKDGHIIYSDRVELSKDQLPVGFSIGDIIHWEGGLLQSTSETKKSIALALREKTFGISKNTSIPKIVFNGSSTNRLDAPIELPKLDLSILTAAQKATLKQMFEKYPEGIPYYELKNKIAVIAVMGGRTDVN